MRFAKGGGQRLHFSHASVRFNLLELVGYIPKAELTRTASARRVMGAAIRRPSHAATNKAVSSDAKIPAAIKLAVRHATLSTSSAGMATPIVQPVRSEVREAWYMSLPSIVAPRNSLREPTPWPSQMPARLAGRRERPDLNGEPKAGKACDVQLMKPCARLVPHGQGAYAIGAYQNAPCHFVMCDLVSVSTGATSGSRLGGPFRGRRRRS